jgi:hypothetical protein
MPYPISALPRRGPGRSASSLRRTEGCIEGGVRRDRHHRRMDLLALPVRAVTALAYGAGGLLAALVGLGVLLAIADRDVHQLAVPTLVLARAVRLVVVSVAWGPILLAVPWLDVRSRRPRRRFRTVPA